MIIEARRVGKQMDQRWERGERVGKVYYYIRKVLDIAMDKQVEDKICIETKKL